MTEGEFRLMSQQEAVQKMKADHIISGNSNPVGKILQFLMGEQFIASAPVRNQKIKGFEPDGPRTLFQSEMAIFSGDHPAEFSRRSMVQKRGKIQHSSFFVFEIRHVHRLEFCRWNKADWAIVTPFSPDKSEPSASGKKFYGKQILPFFQWKEKTEKAGRFQIACFHGVVYVFPVQPAFEIPVGPHCHFHSAVPVGR